MPDNNKAATAHVKYWHGRDNKRAPNIAHVLSCFVLCTKRFQNRSSLWRRPTWSNEQSPTSERNYRTAVFELGVNDQQKPSKFSALQADD